MRKVNCMTIKIQARFDVVEVTEDVTDYFKAHLQPVEWSEDLPEDTDDPAWEKAETENAGFATSRDTLMIETKAALKVGDVVRMTLEVE